MTGLERARVLAGVCLACVLLVACATGPDYVRPVVAAPAVYRQEPPAGWKAADASDRLSRGRWWTLFGDSTLDALADQAVSANHTVQASEAALQRGRHHVEHSTGRAVSRGKLSEADQRSLIDRITFVVDLQGLAACDLVVEAVPEQLDLKREIFGKLDTIVRPDAILATNTSSLSVTEISADKPPTRSP